MIKKYLTALICLFLLGACSSNPKKDPDLKVSYDEFQKILSLGSIILLEGKNSFLTVASMPGDKYRKVYSYDIKTKSFSMIYDHGRGVSHLSEDRTGHNIYLHIDNNGDENTQIYRFNPTTKKATHLFGKKGFKSVVSNTDQTGVNLFFVSNHQNKAVYSLFKMNLKSKKVERLSDGKTNISDAIISPNGKTAIATRYLSNNENQVFKIDVSSKEMNRIFKRKASTFQPSFIGHKGQYVYGTSDYKRDRSGCAKIPLNKPNWVYYVKEDKNKDTACSYGEWSKSYMLYESFKGRTSLKLYKKMFAKEIKIPKLFDNQTVSPIGFDRTNNKMLLKYIAANNPGSLYLFDLKTKKVDHVIDFNKSNIPATELATSIDFNYKSFDGMDIHGIIYAKKGWKDSGKKFPLIVWPHGGPDSHERHNFRAWFQFMALNGFVVFAPNYRGSTGYGKKFETLNDKDWGGAHIKDVISGREAVEKLPWIDEQNVFIWGGSFGGYSTLATVTFHPKAFKAAVGFVAIGNLFTFMKSIPPDEAWQSEFTREMGDPVKDKELYRERSPFFHVEKISIPLQIYQAENDIRTVKPEMDAFVAEMKRKGKKVDYFVMKDVGHGLARPESRKLVTEGTVRFFRKQMKR